MKKNRMMRLASILLVCVLLTTSVISGTFAKYTTQDSASDMARVAKWGINVMVSGNLFGTDYKVNDSSAEADRVIAKTSNSVSSSDTDNLVAPGTMNDTGFTVKITGTPEVSYNVEATTTVANNKEIFLGAGEWGVMVKATGLNATMTDMSGYYTKNPDNSYSPATGAYAAVDYYELHDYVNVAADYYPIVWTVNNTGKVTAISEQRLSAIATAMVNAFNAADGDAKASADASYTLTWVWPFDNTKTAGSHINDGADTILGNLKAGTAVVYKTATGYAVPDTAKYCLDMGFNFSVTVTQVD